MITDRKIYVMQRIQQAVVKGVCTRYVTIETDDVVQVQTLVRKFNKKYEADVSAPIKSRRRKYGEATTTLFVYRRPEKRKPDAKAYWLVLLVSDGKGLVETEDLAAVDNPRRRLTLDGYELVHDGKGWSWRMTRATYDGWAKNIREVCALAPSKRKDSPVQKLIDGLANTPGFRLARQQVGKLFGRFRAEWRRLRPATDPMPELPTFLRYVQLLPKKPKRKRASTGEG